LDMCLVLISEYDLVFQASLFYNGCRSELFNIYE